MPEATPRLQLSGETRVVGVIGWPVRHSLSPPMHNAAFAVLGLNWVYVPFSVDPERIAEAMAAVRALDLAGLNVTIPHKLAVLPYLDEISDDARLLGAVNTVVPREGRLLGYNTDGQGFLRSLEATGEPISGSAVVLIGAGGSARAVALALARAGAASLTVVNRTLERAQAVVELLRSAELCGAYQALALDDPRAAAAVGEAGVVVDSTAVGMYPHHEVEPVIPSRWLHGGQVVCDLTYNPRETVLLRAAAAAGARTLDGTGMLVHQGALALEYWTGREAPAAAMRAALLACLAR